MPEERKKKGTEEQNPTKGSALWGILLFGALVLIDQLTKALADAYLADRAPIEVIKGWIKLTIVHNPGISYGLASNLPEWGKIGIVVLTAVMMLALSVLYFKVNRNRKLVRTGLVFVVAGGVGNLIDRVYYKIWTLDAVTADALGAGVRDMVDLNRFGFAVCNFADFFITAGAIMLVLAFLFFDKDAFFPVGKYKEIKRSESAEKNSEEAERDDSAKAE